MHLGPPCPYASCFLSEKGTKPDIGDAGGWGYLSTRENLGRKRGSDLGRLGAPLELFPLARDTTPPSPLRVGADNTALTHHAGHLNREISIGVVPFLG